MSLSSTTNIQMPLYLDVPFVGLLLSIAVMPLFFAKTWHHHHGKVVMFWTTLLLIGLFLTNDVAHAILLLGHATLGEYLPFIALITSLYVVSGGLLVTGTLHGSPALNTAFLAIGSFMASIVGTVGASMILIRPIIRANHNRPYKVHVIVFFILTVSNIGGALSPLGDPPLFLGFLRGVSFFWTTTNLLPHTLMMLGSLLFIFYFLDHTIYKISEKRIEIDDTHSTQHARLGLKGKVNILLLGLVVGFVLLSGLWDSSISYTVLGTELALQEIIRDAALIAIALASLLLTNKSIRRQNHFTFEPIKEVSKLFAGIFITLIPILQQLKEGELGVFAKIFELTTSEAGSPINAAFFWLTGILSSFLDNAPTYVLFFNLAGGDSEVLQGVLAPTLAAISAGAVFMGANTYIGNAPNFMVKAIAEERGIRMPGFFGYMAWSFAILMPLFILLTLIFF